VEFRVELAHGLRDRTKAASRIVKRPHRCNERHSFIIFAVASRLRRVMYRGGLS
jgi:hypothetical protein